MEAPREGPRFVWPVARSTLVTARFDDTGDAWKDRPGSRHDGMDFGCIAETPVQAMADGHVARVFWDTKGGGNMVVLEHPGGWKSYYAHLFKEPNLPVGLPVVSGQVIALSGATGIVTGPHLHVHVNDPNGQRYDSEKLFGDTGGGVAAVPGVASAASATLTGSKAVRILVNPERLRAFAAEMHTGADALRHRRHEVQRALHSLDWEVRQREGLESQTTDALRRTDVLAGALGDKAARLQDRIQAFVAADSHGARDFQDLGRHSTLLPLPRRLARPGRRDQSQADAGGSPVGPDIPDVDRPKSIETIVGSAASVLKSIDWVADSKRAREQFLEALDHVGRLLDQTLGDGGHGKVLRGLGHSVLGGGAALAKWLDGIADILLANKARLWLTNQITTGEMTRAAVETLVPIPFLNQRVGQWAEENMPPWQRNGHFIDKVISE